MAISPAAGRWFTNVAPTTRRADLEALFDELEAALRSEGLTAADVARNRLVAASRAARDEASAVRFARLSGPARCATSSYIDSAAFPFGGGVRVETLAVPGFGAHKLVAEHEPRQPPCMFVAGGGLVFLAGITSTEPDWPGQIAHVRRRIAETLRVAASLLGGPVRPAGATAWVHRDVAPIDAAGLAVELGLDGVDLAIERCEGYSKRGKVVEIEIDAVLGATPPG